MSLHPIPTYEQEQLLFFALMLKRVIDGEKKYRQFVMPVIFDAVSLALGAKDYYNVDRSNLSIICHLIDQDKPFFERLDMYRVSKDDLKKIFLYAWKKTGYPY